MYASVEKLNDFKLKYGLIDPDTHQRISGEVRATLAYLELVRNAMRANAPFEDLPVFVESDQGATRTQSELRWKVKCRYPNFLSLSLIGFKLLLDEMRALILRRSSLLEWSGQRSVSRHHRLPKPAEKE